MSQLAVVLQNVIVLYTLGDSYLLRDRENISQVFVRNICQLFAVFYQLGIESIFQHAKLRFPTFWDD